MDESSAKFCRYCQEEMNKRAKYCPKCQHYQFSLLNLHKWGFLLTALIVPAVVWLSTIAHNYANKSEQVAVSNCDILNVHSPSSAVLVNTGNQDVFVTAIKMKTKDGSKFKFNHTVPVEQLLQVSSFLKIPTSHISDATSPRWIQKEQISESKLDKLRRHPFYADRANLGFCIFSENDAFYGELVNGKALDRTHIFSVEARAEFYDIYSGEYFESAALPCKLVFQQEAEDGLIPSIAQVISELDEVMK